MPDTTPPKPIPYDDFGGLLAHFPDRIAVVDNTEIMLAAPNGYWQPLPVGTTRHESSVLMALISEARSLDQHPTIVPTSSQLSHCALRVQQLVYTPVRHGVRYLAAQEFNHRRVLPLHNGNTLDIRSGQEYNPGAMRELMLTNRKSPGVRWQPDILTTPPPDAIAILQHYGEAVFQRLAYCLAYAPSKHVDVIVSPIVHSGKDTLILLLSRAFPGLVFADTAKRLFAGQSEKFTVLNRALCDYIWVFANECDKLEKDVDASTITALTGDHLRDERKGIDAIMRARAANLCAIGNDDLPVEHDPAVSGRMGWQYRADWPVMPQHLRHAAANDCNIALYFAAYIIQHAMNIAANGDHTWQDGAQYARDVAAANISDEVLLLQQNLERGNPNDFITTDELVNFLNNNNIPVSDAKDRRIGKWIAKAVPNAKRYRKAAAGEQRRGYTHLRWRTNNAA